MFAGHLAGGLGFFSRFVFFDTTSHWIIGHIRLELFLCSSFFTVYYLDRDRLRKSLRIKNISSRLLFTTSTDAAQL